MNKNTLTGLFLMGLVILAFMYINKPTQAEIDAAKAAQQEQTAINEKTDAATEPTITEVDAETRANIIKTIRQNGTLDEANGSYTLAGRDVTLNLAADSTISGEVKVGNTIVSAHDLLWATYPDSISVATANAALNTLNAAIDESVKYQGFARYRNGSDSTVATLSNDVLSLDFTSRGAQIATAKLLDPKYKKFGGGQVEPFANGTNDYGFTITSDGVPYDTRQLYFSLVEQTDSSVTLAIEPGDGAMLGLRYTLPKGNSYVVKMELVQKNMNNVISQNVTQMEFNWNQKMARNEEGRQFESQNSALYYQLASGDVDNLSEMKDASKTIDQPLQWIGFKNQFFSSVFITQKAFFKAEVNSVDLKDSEKYVKDLTAKASITDYSSALAVPVSMDIFIGPNSYPLLSELSDQIVPEKDLKLTNLIPLGWSLFRWINTWIVIPVFDFLGGFNLNYGIIILLLTLFIKLILFPFTYKSYMSQAKMRVLAPEIKEINDKYPTKEDALKRQQETMALYSRAGASPLSGCLPMLLQLPILIAMFKFFPSAIELRGESFLWAHDLSAPDYIITLPFAIPFLGNKLSLFCLLMTAVNIIYTRINMQNQPSNSQMPAMKWMMYLMPVMFLVFFNNYASGLSYYYLLSLLITIIQTYVFRLVIDEQKVRATMKANAAKPKKKSGFMARLEEAQRKQQAMLREQQKQRGGKSRR